MPVALITCLHLQRDFDRYRAEFERHGVEAVLPEVAGQRLNASQMAAVIDGVDAAIAGDDVIDAMVLERGSASELKAVIKWGVGTDGIDKAAARRLGIPVYNTPGMFGGEVADLALSHLLLLARQTHVMHGAVLDGRWQQVQGRSLGGLRAGVIGLGTIGSAIARRLSGFGMDVAGYDVREVPEQEHGVRGLQQLPLDQLLSRSDVLFVACQLTPDNHHLLSHDAFEAMPTGSLVINVSRGPLVDEVALVGALRSGKVAGAGLDVFEEEPLPADSPLRAFADRCTFSTHNGSNTAEAVSRTNDRVTEILFEILGLRQGNGPAPSRVA